MTYDANPLSLANLVIALHSAYTKGLEKGSDLDWTFRECEVHNAAHKFLDKRLAEALEIAHAEEACAAKVQAEKGCAGCKR